ncbi:MAG TPA: hypothetical protein VF502_12340 [Stellaceae bacterium]
MQRAALGREVRELTGIPKASLPFSIPNLDKGSRHGVMISATKLNTLVEKWARGFYYCVHGQPLSASRRIQVIHVGDEHAAVAFREIWQHARAIDGGPGVQVRLWTAEEDRRREEIYGFSIWGQFRVYAAVSERL